MSYPNPDPAQYTSGPTPTAPIPPLPSDRRSQAYVGGILAGLAIAGALAIVMRVIQEQSPNGYAIGIQGSVLLVMFLGLIIGLGLGMGLAAAVPERAADSAAPHHTPPIDQLPPSA